MKKEIMKYCKKNVFFSGSNQAIFFKDKQNKGIFPNPTVQPP
jgi:hypothetical protein